MLALIPTKRRVSNQYPHTAADRGHTAKDGKEAPRPRHPVPSWHISILMTQPDTTLIFISAIYLKIPVPLHRQPMLPGALVEPAARLSAAWGILRGK